MANKINCVCNVLEKIDEFHSIGEFERFQKHINEFLKDGDLVEVPVQKKYAGFVEQWFKCASCGQIWRLIHPDFPFKGIWDIVE